MNESADYYGIFILKTIEMIWLQINRHQKFKKTLLTHIIITQKSRSLTYYELPHRFLKIHNFLSSISGLSFLINYLYRKQLDCSGFINHIQHFSNQKWKHDLCLSLFLEEMKIFTISWHKALPYISLDNNGPCNQPCYQREEDFPWFIYKFINSKLKMT